MLCIANWKMKGSAALLQEQFAALAQDKALQADLERVSFILCPPSPYLSQAQQWREQYGLTQSIALGAQDLSAHAPGAHTGEVAAEMLADLGVDYVIIGHSERRTHHQESIEQIDAKMQRALSCGLKPILCIGETLAEREEGRTQSVLMQQIQPLLKSAPPQGLHLAYEPLWAIGTGLNAQAADIAPVLAFLQETLGSQIPLVYGGSVQKENLPQIVSSELLATGIFSGVLVGNASLEYAKIAGIISFLGQC